MNTYPVDVQCYLWSSLYSLKNALKIIFFKAQEEGGLFSRHAPIRSQLGTSKDNSAVTAFTTPPEAEVTYQTPWDYFVCPCLAQALL